MAAEKDKLAPGTKMALFAMALGIFVIGNDFTALNVVIPAIEEDFNVDVGTAQWVINAYALFFGLAIVTGGRLADMYGRRKIFFIGSALFAGFSLVGGLAPSVDVLILMRVGMAFGGALMWPAILGMTYAELPASRAALGGALILGVAGLSNAVGPMLGGALAELISWRAILFLNVPVAAIAVSVTYFKLHQTEDRQRERIDYAGVATLSLAVLLLLLALDQGTDWGFGDPRIVAMLVASVVLIASFGVIEPRMGEGALVPMSVIRNREFAGACAAVLLMSAVFFVVVFYVPQYLIKILDYSALEAGAGLLPMMGMFALTSFSASGIYDRFGAKAVISTGAVALVIGSFMLSLIGDDAGYSSFVLGLVVVGFGVGLFYSAVTTAAITALPESKSSLAGGLIYMCQIAGGAVGLATITAVFTSVSENELSSEAADAGTKLSESQESVLHGLLAGTDAATAALAKIMPAKQAEIEQIVSDSFVAGIQVGFKVVAAVALVGLIVSVVYVGGRLGGSGGDGAEEEAADPVP
ncbi:MAG TPA: DHA2 family efflux MFS transporter permease subunit [Solirubrobacterales bacterium]|nr:DHA2 family efflux MFS transporter permease subunit [Solirubrobacterales bacterium]